MGTELRRLTLQLLEAVDARYMGADLDRGVTYDHGAAEALQTLMGALAEGDEASVTYVLTIALEVLSELPAPAPFQAFLIEFRRRAGPGQPAADASQIGTLSDREPR